MLSYLDRTYCASPNCTNKCGRALSTEDREKAIKIDMPIAWGYFCGEPSEEEE